MSVFTTSAPQVASLIAEIAAKVGVDDHAGLTAIKAYLEGLSAAPAAPAAATATKKRKPSTKPATATAPAPAAGGVVVSFEPTADDPLRSHTYRIKSIDAAHCLGRKVDLKNQIVGTRKDDAGSNGIFWPEKQCSKKPEPGETLCRFCKEKDDDVKAGKSADKHWFGRLDEPIFYKACVVGCGDFFHKYPAGIPSDPSTAPPAGYTPKAPSAAIAAKKRGPKPKTPTGTATATPVDSDDESETAAPAPAPAAPATPPKQPKKTAAAAAAAKAPAAPKKPKATVAKTASAPVEAEWVVLMYEGRVVARNTTTNYVYEMDAETAVDNTADIGKTVRKSDYLGAWKNGAVDAYDLSGAAAAEEDDEAEEEAEEEDE
jgi:hypothetical protein